MPPDVPPSEADCRPALSPATKPADGRERTGLTAVLGALRRPVSREALAHPDRRIRGAADPDGSRPHLSGRPGRGWGPRRVGARVRSGPAQKLQSES